MVIWPEFSRSLRRRARWVDRRLRESRMFARAMASKYHPILAHLVPIRRCNLACAYCNEFDAVSAPVPLAEMLRRIDLLADLGTTIITISGGEPLLHPDLDEIIRRIRRRGAIATLITNGYLLTVERIRRLNRAGLDYLQISIDNVNPDETSKKSLKVLDRKLEWLGGHAEFAVTVNSVLGSPVRNSQDARTIALRARELGLGSTVGILHDGDGQLQPLAPDHLAIYRDLLQPDHKDVLVRAVRPFSEKHLGGAPEPLALSCGRPLPLYLREWPGSLLLATARASGDTAGTLYPRGPPAGGGAREDMRALLHGIVRASDGDARCLSRGPEAGVVGNDRGAPGAQSRISAAGLALCADVDVPRWAGEPGAGQGGFAGSESSIVMGMCGGIRAVSTLPSSSAPR